MFKEKQAVYSADMVLSTGQILSIPFFIAGIVLIIWSHLNKNKMLFNDKKESKNKSKIKIKNKGKK